MRKRDPAANRDFFDGVIEFAHPTGYVNRHEVVQAGYAERLEQTLFGEPGTKRGYKTAECDPEAVAS